MFACTGMVQKIPLLLKHNDCLGLPHYIITTPAVIAKVDGLIRINRWMTVEERYSWTSFCFGRKRAWLEKNWLGRQPTIFFKSGIDRLVSQWDKFINRFWDYFWDNKCSIIIFGIWPIFIRLSLIYVVHFICILFISAKSLSLLGLFVWFYHVACRL